jgi:hypothetical protein
MAGVLNAVAEISGRNASRDRCADPDRLYNGGGFLGPGLLFALCIVSLPLAFFARTRALPAVILSVSSQIFWLGLWVLGFLIVYHLWGVGWLVGGLLLGLVGVVPLAALAALLGGAWPLLGALAGSFVVALVASFGGAWLSTLHERRAYAA